MYAALTALGVVAGLVVLAVRSTTRPVRSVAWAKIRLKNLASKPRNQITLDEAEDGLVLSRRLKVKPLEREFAKLILKLRKNRPVV
jgi:hypothetical protein